MHRAARLLHIHSSPHPLKVLEALSFLQQPRNPDPHEQLLGRRGAAGGSKRQATSHPANGGATGRSRRPVSRAGRGADEQLPVGEVSCRRKEGDRRPAAGRRETGDMRRGGGRPETVGERARCPLSLLALARVLAVVNRRGSADAGCRRHIMVLTSEEEQ